MPNKIRDRLQLTIGPLHYELRAYDDWGQNVLARLRNHVACVAFDGLADQVLHLARPDYTPQEVEHLLAAQPPDGLTRLLAVDPARAGWKSTYDMTGHIFLHGTGTQHAVWTCLPAPWADPGPFQLPWPLLFEDILERGGAILHGGLAAIEQRGYIFTAPSGGGKTTTVGRLASPWQVLADDTVLVWPDNDGNGFLASPLPTWSVLTGQAKWLPMTGIWKVATPIVVARVYLLQKYSYDSVQTIFPVAAVPGLYRALRDHMAVFPNRDGHRVALFHTASRLARMTPVAELQLTLDGAFWTHLRSTMPEV